MEEEIQKRIDETLNASYIKPLSPKPFFYTRVKTRMEREPSSIVQLIPISLKVICSAVLIINAIFFFSSFTPDKRETSSEQLASFYHFNSTSVYSMQ